MEIQLLLPWNEKRRQMNDLWEKQNYRDQILSGGCKIRYYWNGTKYWYLNGRYHRLDGPACEYANGDKEWFQNGQRHNEDGPAIEYGDGEKIWYQHDILMH